MPAVGGSTGDDDDDDDLGLLVDLDPGSELLTSEAAEAEEAEDFLEEEFLISEAEEVDAGLAEAEDVEEDFLDEEEEESFAVSTTVDEAGCC